MNRDRYLSLEPGLVLSYQDMCSIERASLQRGMNYRMHGNRTIVLMSRRPNAPYADDVSEDGRIIYYEGHDAPKSAELRDPKTVDQPIHTSTGRLTQNGYFKEAADKHGQTPLAERVVVYEKIRDGIWVYNGVFKLDRAWSEVSAGRSVWKFQLAIDDIQIPSTHVNAVSNDLNRMIPTSVKQEVWKRDGGKCVQCESTNDLHFDHIIPYSKGGSSRVAANIQLLCARHNLYKSDKIL